MAQLALGIVGAVAGFAIGGPVGAQIGFLAGSALGSLLFPEVVYGPKLTDLRLQGSQYGGMIPRVWGSMRVAGQVIWQTDLEGHEHKSSGKGGPEVVNTTYTASFAIALCDCTVLGPMDRIRRVWWNGRLVRDPDQGSAEEAPDDEDLPFAFYPGSTDQGPDPTMEAVLGAGNVPAYRGTCYVVFTDKDLTDGQNVIGNWEFELVQKGITGCAVSVVAANDSVSSDTGVPVAFTGYLDGTFRITRFPKGGGSLGAGPQDPTTACSVNSYVFDAVTLADLGQDLDNPPDPFPSEFDLIGPDPVNPGFSVDNRYKPMGFHVYTDGHAKALWKGFAVVSGSDEDVSVGDSTTEVNPTDGRHSVNTNGDWAHTAGVPAGRYLRAASFTGNNRATFLFTDTVASRFIPLSGSSYDCITEWWKVKNGLVVASGTCSGTFVDSDGNHVMRAGDFDTYGSAGNMSEAGKASSFDLDERHCWYCSGDQVRMYHIDDDGDFALDTVCGTGSMGGTNGGGIAVLAFKKGYCAAYVDDSGDRNLRVFTLIPEGVTTDVTLGEIVGDISELAGLAEDEVDVTDLPDPVDGYIVSQQGPARGWIEPLQSAWFFDPVEVDGAVTFVKRGAASLVEIPDEDLAAHDDGDELPDTITVVRGQDDDLPQKVNVDYLQIDADYQVGSQVAERQTGNSQAAVTISLQVAMSDAKAKAVALTNVHMPWVERERLQIAVTRKYLRLRPTNVITAGGYVMRINKVEEAPSGVIKIEGVPSLASLFSQPGLGAIGGLGSQGGQTLSTKSATDLLLLDIPLVADTDKDDGFYAAVEPASTGSWPGVSLQKSSDGGSSYAEVAAITARSVIGETTTVLPDFRGGNIVDESSTVTVLLHSGSLSGINSEALLNGGNEFLIGDEIVNARDCELVDVDTYQLTGFLRGRRGTEDFKVAHEVGERFVVLPVTDVDAPFADLQRSRKYKPVTFGKTLDSATAQDFVNTGNRLKPYSPVQLNGGVLPSGDVVLNWIPRTRIGGDWNDLADAPMSDPNDYVVEIWDASYTLCARIIEVTNARTATYTTADQTTDFGGDQETVYFTVAQKGSIGIGTRARGTASGDGGSVDMPLSPIAPYASGPLNPPPVVGGPADQVLVSGVRGYTSGFTVGGRYVWKFTTGASISLGSISTAEYIDPRMQRTATLALDSTGTSVLKINHGSSLSLAFPFDVTLTPLTDYYWILEDKLANGSPSGVPGATSNMFCDLLLIP